MKYQHSHLLDEEIKSQRELKMFPKSMQLMNYDSRKASPFYTQKNMKNLFKQRKITDDDVLICHQCCNF